MVIFRLKKFLFICVWNEWFRDHLHKISFAYHKIYSINNYLLFQAFLVDKFETKRNVTVIKSPLIPYLPSAFNNIHQCLSSVESLHISGCRSLWRITKINVCSFQFLHNFIAELHLLHSNSFVPFFFLEFLYYELRGIFMLNFK